MKIFIVIFLFFSFFSYSQEGSDLQLAQYYFSKGEYEKALPYCQKVFQKEENKFNFKRLYECLLYLNKKKEAEKLLTKQIKRQPEDFELSIMLIEYLEKNNESKQAEKVSKELIEQYASKEFSILELYDAFKNAEKNALAFQTLEKGRKTFKNSVSLHLQFAEMYQLKGESENMLKEFMDVLEIGLLSIDEVQTALSKQISFTNTEQKEAEILKSLLLAKVQKKEENPIYYEMLIWLFIQQKNFNTALIHSEALDKRFYKNGVKVLELGQICLQNRKYDSAKKAFKYVLSLGEENPYFNNAEQQLLHSLFTEITEQRNFSDSEIKQTVEEFEKVIRRDGFNPKNQGIVLEYAHILTYYSGQAEKSVELLKNALKTQGLTNMQSAELKMLLADTYIVLDDIWESSLLYMQIDKEFKFDPIGFEAKFKNARIFYYDGDFKFAQTQLDVLKQATSRVIANDAIHLSVLITDNFGLDSNYVAMSQFAKADLLIEQNRIPDAFALLDSIIKVYPFHSLSDDILYKKAIAMEKRGNWKESYEFLEELIKYHVNDILADDAFYHMAQINEKNWNNLEKAGELYKKILSDFPGSLYSEECRKRLRILRGDKIEDDSL
ncbi:MAG: tetratricopeptide repeat protein [Flavobacteriia bacterium]|nr:tetratricopeptide repeat protein [Flavobacteriia bacterium]